MPEDGGYPAPTHGLKLGQRVASIRATGRYVADAKRRATLDGLGFEWRLRRPSGDSGGTAGEPFAIILAALQTYKAEVGDVDAMARTFVAPATEPWPPEARGLPLGSRLELLRAPESPYFEGLDEGEMLGRLAALGDVGVTVGTAAARRPSTRRFEVVFDALVAFKEAHGHVHVPQGFTVPAAAPWPEVAWEMKLGSRVNAIRSHGTFLKRHPERRTRLLDLGLILNLPAEPESPGSILDAVLAAPLLLAEDAAEPEGPRIVPVSVDFFDNDVLSREEFDRHRERGWRFDEFDGGYTWGDVIDALTEYRKRRGDVDVDVSFEIPAPEAEAAGAEAGDEAEDLDAALAAFLSAGEAGAASPADSADESLLGLDVAALLSV